MVNGKEIVERVKEFKDLKTKNSYRTIGIDKELLKLLKEHKKSQKELAKSNGKEFKETDWVFTTKTYQGYVADYSADIMKRAMNDLKITDYKEITVHSLRHTYCSIGIMNGIKAEEMMKILGHSAIDITVSIYSHLDCFFAINASKKVASGIFAL